jgi:hypothetical protein
MNDTPFPESPYNDTEALSLLDDPLIRRPVVYRRQSGRSFLYCRPQCSDPAKLYEQLPLAECAPDIVCCGCWGNVHERPKE